ncbi:hypothetical protein, partial [Klebsiella pneumoniae]|uniref:hypothetical protein n=1 Tax=Klebsiella pneumoniae TaxID=573 RepID=UPI003A84A03B
ASREYKHLSVLQHWLQCNPIHQACSTAVAVSENTVSEMLSGYEILHHLLKRHREETLAPSTLEQL